MLSKIIEGLNQSKVQQSPSESKAVLSAFMDCVSYIVLPRSWNITINNEKLHQLRNDVIDQVRILYQFNVDYILAMTSS